MTNPNPAGTSGVLWPTRAYYGDGSTGPVTISGNTALTADVYYTTLTVTSVLNTAGFRIYADTIINNGTIANLGGNASSTTAGTGGSAGTLGGGTAGGSGITGSGGTAVGNPGVNQLAGLYAILSNTGGAGGSATDVGGAAGTITVYGAGSGDIRVAPQCLLGAVFGISNTGGYPSGSGAGLWAVVGGGSGGGGGAVNSGATSSGAGGGGGGCILVVCRSLQGSGTFSVNGGNGSNAGASGSAAGGGGGGGGTILITSGDWSRWAGTTTAAGGSFGTGIGTGNNGVAGNVGTTIKIQG